MDISCRKVILAPSGETVGTGWLPPGPDPRDYSEQHPKIAAIVKHLGLPQDGEQLPTQVDQRQWCSPVENQGRLGSCTAHAAAGVIEYYERRAFGNYIDVSRLFIYKATRDLMKQTGDSGAYLRDTMAALVLFGAPPEKYWPYTDREPAFDQEPPAFVYALAHNYETVQYFHHDTQCVDAGCGILGSIKKYLAVGVPAMFGFYGFASFDQTDVPGGIPCPGPEEAAQWGHAVVAVGYDDALTIRNTKYGLATTGAFLIRNSWGDGWGEAGYGWLPYEYVARQLAMDFWSIISMEWIDTQHFGL